MAVSRQSADIAGALVQGPSPRTLSLRSTSTRPSSAAASDSESTATSQPRPMPIFSDGPALPRHEPEQPEAMLRKRARALIRLPSVPFLGAFSVGITRKRPRLLRITPALVERADNLRGLGVDQARPIELPVRVVIVAPAIGESLPEPSAGDLTAKLGPEAPPGVVSTAGHRALDATQVRLHICLERARWWRRASCEIRLVVGSKGIHSESGANHGRQSNMHSV
jgi:hypothetical protein